MRAHAPFLAADLAELDEALLSRASAVVAMEDCHDGHRAPSSIGMRHDVDAGHALATAVRIAEWEAERGYRATFFVLHTSPYWEAPGFREALDEIAGYGHEIGIHSDALAEAIKTGRDPDVILDDALGVLRGYGFRVRGVAGHGNRLCNYLAAPGEVWFANDEQFVECARPKEGQPDRTITRGNLSLTLHPRPLADFGLDYEALKVGYGPPKVMPFRISDSGGKWLNPGWEETVVKWQAERVSAPGLAFPTHAVRQMHFLWHPDWWAEAFVAQAVAA